MRKPPADKRARRVNHLAVSDNFRKFVLDQLEELQDVEPKSMFGGVGLDRGGLFFGIVAGDVLYLKADDETGGTFEAAGSQPFDPYPGRAGEKCNTTLCRSQCSKARRNLRSGRVGRSMWPAASFVQTQTRASA